jgi:hypothetical protein
MTDWRVLLLAGCGLLVLLGGLLILALPGTYEGGVVYTFDATHTVRTLDAVGLLLLVLGAGLSWAAGALWRRLVATQ